MQTAKQEVRELLDTLPDDSSLEDIQYHLYVRQKVQRGIQDISEAELILNMRSRSGWKNGAKNKMGRRCI